jgi:hypothetical protein
MESIQWGRRPGRTRILEKNFREVKELREIRQKK